MIKVLHFVSTPAIWSGVMSVIMNYYRHIDRSRVQFDFLCFSRCSSEESYEREIEELGGRVFFIGKPSPSVRSIRELQLFFKIHKGEYTWFHNHEVYLSFLLRPLSLSYGIKNFIVHCHATRYSDRKIAAVRNRILCIPIRWMTCRKFACSQEAGIFLFGSRAFRKDRVWILHNAIDSEHFAFSPGQRAKMREQLGLTHCFVIGHVGRFVPQKNHSFLLYMFAELIEKCPHARLLLIGCGPLLKIMQEECRALGLEEYVVFLGQQTDMEACYSAMDLFILPSVFEGIGIALLEAQANGLYSLASQQVPDEADATGNVKFLPLDSELWGAECLKAGGNSQQIRAAGGNAIRNCLIHNHYEIHSEAGRLQAYYENTDFNVCI